MHVCLMVVDNNWLVNNTVSNASDIIKFYVRS